MKLVQFPLDFHLKFARKSLVIILFGWFSPCWIGCSGSSALCGCSTTGSLWCMFCGCSTTGSLSCMFCGCATTGSMSNMLGLAFLPLFWRWKYFCAWLLTWAGVLVNTTFLAISLTFDAPYSSIPRRNLLS